MRSPPSSSASPWSARSPRTSYGGARTRSTLTEASGLTEAEARAERIAGWVEADREWSNRGLGGYRAWCREDGVSAAKRFLDVAAGP